MADTELTDRFVADLLNGNGADKDLFSIEFAEEPALLDKRLFLILADLSRSVEGRTILQNNFSLSVRSVEIISRINPSNVRNFIGITNLSFQPALDHATLIETINNFHYKNCDDDQAVIQISPAKCLFNRFCHAFWTAARQQSQCCGGIARLAFGLSEELVETLKGRSTWDVFEFATTVDQYFSLRLGERFFQAIPSIDNAADNPHVALIKIAYAAQSTACFARAPYKLPSTRSFSFFDVFPSFSVEQTTVALLPAKVLKGIRKSTSTIRDLQIAKAENSDETSLSSGMIKQAIGLYLMKLGLTKSQVAHSLGYEVWRARLDSKNLCEPVDSRKRAKHQITPELTVQRLIFYCLYATFSGRRGLETIDIEALCKAARFMNLTTVRTHLQGAKVILADRFDDAKLLIQGLIYLQRCPTCNFVNFYESSAGQFVEEDDRIMPCAFCQIFAKDDSLKLFSRFLKNSNEMTPEKPESYVEKHISHS